MGMFDTILVARSLIEKAVEGTDIVLESCEGYHKFKKKKQRTLFSKITDTHKTLLKLFYKITDIYTHA